MAKKYGIENSKPTYLPWPANYKVDQTMWCKTDKDRYFMQDKH